MSSYDASIAIAVGDSALRVEVIAAAAATSAQVTAVEDPRDFARYLPKATVIVADKLTAELVASHSRAPVLFVAADPGPIDYEAAMKCRGLYHSGGIEAAFERFGRSSPAAADKRQ